VQYRAEGDIAMAADNKVDRAAIAADLERARSEFHQLLTEAERYDAWNKPTHGTRWTNEQLLFHMVFGYMVVQRLLVLVKALSRLPESVSRRFASMLDAATKPFEVINYYGSCAAALVYNRRRMGAKTKALQGERRCPPSRHAFPAAMGSLLQGLHDARRSVPLPRSAFRLPRPSARTHRG
jgi:hypothetical protein